MLDIKFIRENQDLIKKAIAAKKIKLDLDHLLALDEKRKKIQAQTDQLREQRNTLAKKSQQGKPTPEIIAAGKKLKEDIAAQENELAKIVDEYEDLMVKVPTPPSPDTPPGRDERDNVEVERNGKIPDFAFTAKDYISLAKNLDLLDLERGVKVAGYRGYYVKNEAVLLQMGLMMFALEKLISRGFTPIIPPTLVKEFVLFGSGYFSGRVYNKEIDEIYQVANEDKDESGEFRKENKFLIGTAEPSLLAYYSGEVLPEEKLPIKFCGFSQCYRSEIGSYGKDTKGIYRVHEFMKVEQVVICPADLSMAESLHAEMIGLSKELHEDLGLPYRQIQICSGDMSAGKYKMFDLEVWIPSRQGYGESGSASNFLDWQARRLDVRYKSGTGEKKYVYMLNNTALASARMLIAIMENYQNADGSITVPEVLRRYVGKDIIKR